MDQERILPGVVNTQAHFDKLEREKKAREEDATRVIQRVFRGHQGRKLYKKRAKIERDRIEFEYERLNRELKNDPEFNLKSYLA